MPDSLKKILRHVLFALFIFIATFSLLHMWLVQYFFFLVYYAALYVTSERAGGKMTPVMRLIEAALSIYLFGISMMVLLTGIYFAPAFFFAALLFVSVWVILMALKKVSVPRFLFLSLFFPFLCLSFVPDPMLQKQFLNDCARVKSSMQVKPLLTFCDKNWTDGLSPFLKEKNLGSLSHNADSPRAVLVTNDADTVYFSFGRPTYRKPKEFYYAVVKFNRRTGKIAGAIPSSSLIHLAYDGKRKIIYGTALDEDKVYVIDEKTFTLLKKIPVATHPIDAAVDEASNTLVVLCDYGVYLYDPVTGREKNAFEPHMAPNMFAFSAKFQKAYVCGYATVFPMRVINIVSGALDRARAGWIPPFSMLCSGVALDEGQNTLFVSASLESRVYAYHADTLERLFRFHVPRGIRDIEYDAEKQMLYAGNYITGNLEVIDAYGQDLRQEIFVGKRIRDIYYSAAAKKVYAATSLGFFEISPLQ